MGVSRLNPGVVAMWPAHFKLNLSVLSILNDTSLSPSLSVSVGHVLFLKTAPGKPKMTRYPFASAVAPSSQPSPWSQAPMNNEWRAACINVAARPLKECVVAGDCSQPLWGCQQTCAPYSVGYFSRRDLPIPAPLKLHPGKHGWDFA